jgi:flagellar hook-associated protein 3 FlgL
MTRVSTLNTYDSALLDLQRAQARQLKAQTQLSSEKKADDLSGYGRESETLVAFQSMTSRLRGFVQTGESLQARLTTQDLALGRLADSVQRARQSIANAVAAGRSDTLMIELQGQLTDAIEALNAKHQGKQLFAGARVDTPPVLVGRLSDLTDPAFGPWFQNDQLKQVSRLDEATSVETGMLADALGQRAFEAFQQVQAFHESLDGLGQPNALNGGALTADQETFLRGVLDDFDAAYEGITNENARNGALQNRTTATLEGHEAQMIGLNTLIQGKTGVDMAEAITRLQQAQLAVQASAQVLAQLRGISLLDYLR